MTKIYIIRHAEAEGNIFRRIHGHYNSRITHNGERQIAALAERFRDIPIDAVYASDLFRTCRTAQALTEPKRLPLHKDARFREVHFGRWEDYPFGHLSHFEPELMELFSHKIEQLVVEDAESYAQFSSRFLSALHEVAQQNDGKTIAVFTHGCISDNCLRILFGNAARKCGRCDNTGVSLLHYENGVFSAQYFYDNSHLTQEISTFAHQLWWRGKKDFNLWFRPAVPQDALLYDSAYAPHDGHQTVIAMLSDEPVGYLSMNIHCALPTVSCIYLTAAHRYQRMSDQLLGCAVSAARAAGGKTLTVSVPTQNTPMLSVLARHGAAVTQMDDLFTVFCLPIEIPQLHFCADDVVE